MSDIIQPGSAEWHEARRLGIGGSDAAAALGMSKWTTPYQLYMQKIGEADPEDETWEMARGKAMEPLLRQHYADTTRREIRLPGAAMQHPKHSFMRYNPDGLSDDGRLQEFKTATYGREWGDVGSDEIPQEYLLQVQHGMIVTQRDVADVTVSIAGGKPKYFIVEADKELQEMIIQGEAAFWDKVQRRVVPEPISNEDVAQMYSRVNGASIIISPEIRQALEKLKALREAITQKEEEKEKLEVIIKGFMGENETLADEKLVPLATWKQTKAAERIDSAALKKERPEVAGQYIKIGAPIRRFLLK